MKIRDSQYPDNASLARLRRFVTRKLSGEKQDRESELRSQADAKPDDAESRCETDKPS